MLTLPTAGLLKYCSIITALDAETLIPIAYVAKNPPSAGKYDKNKKISRFCTSKEKKLLKLLNILELGLCGTWK